MIVTKYTQLNCILDVWQPHYSSESVYIACYKIDRSKLDIKLRFEKVGSTSEYAGDWYISRKKAKSYRKKFNNNHQACYIIPWEAFERLTITEDRSMYV